MEHGSTQLVVIEGGRSAAVAIPTPEPKHYGANELAVLIRRDLKAAFPAVKFSVRSDHYAGGSAVRVRWTDGPTTEAVEAIVKPYEGIGFDGMTDSTRYHGIFVDGQPASAGSYITTSREQTDFERRAEVAQAYIRERCAVDEHGRFGNDYIVNLGHALIRHLGTDQPSVDVAFRRGVLRDRDAAEPCGTFTPRPEDAAVAARDYHRCATCRQERHLHVEVVIETPKEEPMKRTASGRCAKCSAPRTRKDLTCLRCASNANSRVVLDDGAAPTTHRCSKEGCTVEISNRYPTILLCTEHSLEGARAERARLAALSEETHAKRVAAGKRLAAEQKAERKVQQAVQSRKAGGAMNEKADQPTTDATATTTNTEDTMNTKRNSTVKAKAKATTTKRTPSTDRAAKVEPKAKAPKAPKEPKAKAPREIEGPALFGHPIRSVLRAMGTLGLSIDDAKAAVAKLGGGKIDLKEKSYRMHVSAGLAGVDKHGMTRTGAPAKLSPEETAQLKAFKGAAK